MSLRTTSRRTRASRHRAPKGWVCRARFPRDVALSWVETKPVRLGAKCGIRAILLQRRLLLYVGTLHRLHRVREHLIEVRVARDGRKDDERRSLHSGDHLV